MLCIQNDASVATSESEPVGSPTEATGEDDEDEEGDANDPDSADQGTTGSTLYFFDAALVPGCPAPKLTAAVLPTSNESTGLVDAATTQRTLSPKGNKMMSTMQSSASMASSAGGMSSKARTTGGAGGSKRVVELTEENLKLIGKGGVEQQDVAETTKHVPDGWQAIVKRGYRASRIDKNARQTRLMKRMDQIRREM